MSAPYRTTQSLYTNGARPPPVMNFSPELSDDAGDWPRGVVTEFDDEPAAEDVDESSEFVVNDEEQNAQGSDDDEAADSVQLNARYRTPRTAVRGSPPGAPLRAARTYARTRRGLSSFRRQAFSFGVAPRGAQAARADGATVDSVARTNDHKQHFNVLSGDGVGVSAFEHTLAALETTRTEIDALRTLFADAKPRIEAAAGAIETVGSAAVRLRELAPSSVQVLALRRMGERGLARFATHTQAVPLLHAANDVGRLLDHISQASDALARIGDTVERAAALRSALARIAYPAESEGAARALLGTFAQRPHTSSDRDVFCIICRHNADELDAKNGLYRINPVCTMHVDCAARDDLCRCSTLFCESCLVDVMRRTYAEQRAPAELDGTSRGIDPPSPTMDCPQCRLAFCFADMQRVELPEAGVKRAAEEPSAKAQKTTPRAKRTRRAARASTN